MKLSKLFLVLPSLFAAIPAQADVSSIRTIATHAFKRPVGGYAAFPSLYQDIDRRVILRFTARDRASHVNDGGSSYIYTTTDCGMTWNSEEKALPPAVYYTGVAHHYRQINAGGWRRIEKQKIPKNAIVREEHGSLFIAQNLFAFSSKDDGETWQKEIIGTPAHGSLMNHNIGSHLVTLKNSYLAASYFKAEKNSLNQVLIARQSKESSRISISTIPLSNSKVQLGSDETALIQGPDGRIFAFMRPDPDKLNRLIISVSENDGINWSTPKISELNGYPPHATLFRSEIIITTADRHSFPLRILVYRLDAVTLKIKSEHTIYREIIPRPSDFGYPITISCGDGRFLSAYYRPHLDGGAEVASITWQ